MFSTFFDAFIDFNYFTLIRIFTKPGCSHCPVLYIIPAPPELISHFQSAGDRECDRQQEVIPVAITIKPYEGLKHQGL
ncbi:hypothetical protein QUA54_06975 [Microcoleus sp. MOSTC5]|uniref:hypothetical protein n=1 Tax=Microcoleus sp. MOSTC5 TaxID=3055378 RepID=UPI002FCEC156